MDLLRANRAIKALLVCLALVFAGCAQQVEIGRFAGQGTINVPSWSPDSNYVAFVSYRLVKP